MEQKLIRKVIVSRLGDESVLEVIQAQIESPRAREVQVQVLHSIVSGSDVNMRRGTYPFQKKPPFTPGYCMLGRVIKNVADCQKFAIGSLVACLTVYGAKAERMNLPEKFLVPVPEALDRSQAVALILDWLTAYRMLERRAKVKPGQRIFVHGLSGAVGNALFSLAKLKDVEIHGTAAASKHDVLHSSGAVPYDYKEKNWITDIQRLGGVDAVFDPLGYESFDESYSILRKGGLLVGYGQNLPALTHTPQRSALPMVLKLFARNLAFWSGKRTTFFGLLRGSKGFNADMELLFQWLGEGRIHVPIKGVFPLDQIQEAHRTYAKNATIGSIVINVSPQ